MQYNPQVEIQITRLNSDGSESEVSDNFTAIADYDLNYHSANKPLDFKAAISKRLGSDQDTCTITIQNPPFIEELRQDPRAFVEPIANKFYRIRVWAWHDDNGQVQRSQRPQIPPVWVGDILDGFGGSPTGDNDSSLSIDSSSHSWLATSGKMRKTWASGTSYYTIVDDIFDWFLNERGYGRETIGSSPKKVIPIDEQSILSGKTTKKAFTINRNPIEVVNDICRDFDMLFGFHCNIPYILSRDLAFIQNALNSIQLPEEFQIINADTGKIGLSNYSSFSFDAKSIFNAYQIIGTDFNVDDKPQVDGKSVIGRIDSCEISLSNGVDGHINNMSLSYLGESGKTLLPRRRNNSSGSVLL